MHFRAAYPCMAIARAALGGGPVNTQGNHVHPVLYAPRRARRCGRRDRRLRHATASPCATPRTRGRPGIYAGPGMMYDAQRPGTVSGLHSIWTMSGVSFGRM